jgi:hypothetical protein
LEVAIRAVRSVMIRSIDVSNGINVCGFNTIYRQDWEFVENGKIWISIPEEAFSKILLRALAILYYTLRQIVSVIQFSFFKLNSEDL